MSYEVEGVFRIAMLATVRNLVNVVVLVPFTTIVCMMNNKDWENVFLAYDPH